MRGNIGKGLFAAGLLLAGFVLLALFLGRDQPGGSGSSGGNGTAAAVEIVASNLDVPWKVVELPDGDLLVTERRGQLKRIGDNERSYVVEGVYPTSEGGLLGLALHPEFPDNGWVYVYLTAREGGEIINRVERYRYDQDRLSDRKIILDNIPGARTHDGGALLFGSDGLLYIATGDAQDEPAAQDTKSLAGKILRVTDEGGIPADNPFGNAVYSYGHRNPQGLAWDSQGRLWATEHGRSVTASGYDELNLIEKGANYGWPFVQGDETRPGMRAPVVHSGPDTTWAPSGLAYADGSLYFAGLRGRALYEARLQENGQVELRKHLEGEYGRLRGVTAAGGHLLVTTSNRDGRGDPGQDDDRILQVPLVVL